MYCRLLLSPLLRGLPLPSSDPQLYLSRCCLGVCGSTAGNFVFRPRFDCHVLMDRVWGLGLTLEWARTLTGEKCETIHPELSTWGNPWPVGSCLLS